MNYPKLRQGPTPAGEALSRALDNIETPCVTSYGQELQADGNVSMVMSRTKAGGFKEVFRYPTTKKPEPFLSTSPQPDPALLDPPRGVVPKTFTGYPGTGRTDGVYVGDGFVGAVWATGDLNSPFFPMLMKARSPGTAVLSTEPEATTRNFSVAFADAAITPPSFGLGGRYFTTLYALGWKNETERYVFAWYVRLSNEANPRIFIGNTGTMTLTECDLGLDPSRFQLPSTFAVTAPGRLEAYVQTREDVDTVDELTTPGGSPYFFLNYLPYVAPFMLSTADFGVTWDQTPAPETEPFTFFGGDQFVESSVAYPLQNRLVADYSTPGVSAALLTTNAQIVGLGGGAALMCLSLGMVDTKPAFAPDTVVGGVEPVYAPVMFKRTSFSGPWVRIPWPADTLTNLINSLDITTLQMSQTCQWSCQPGAAFFRLDLSIYSTGPLGFLSRRILSTDDSGDTWHQLDVDDQQQAIYACLSPGTVLTPVDVAGQNQLRRFNPTFDTGADLGGPYSAALLGLVNLRSVHPGYPGLFDRPS